MSRSIFLYQRVPVPSVLRAELRHPAVSPGILLTGAVPCTQMITFSLVMSTGVAAVHVELLLHRDDDGANFSFPLTWVQRKLDTERWSLQMDPVMLCADGESGLFFYHYRIQTPYGAYFCGLRRGTPDPVLVQDPAQTDAFYLTVFQKEFTVPTWMYGATLYQIFPDRFARSGICKDAPTGLPPVRPADKPNALLHQNWDAPIEQFGEHCTDFVRNDEFFGGTLRGITEKLAYLQSLGVTCLYLCPIFSSVTNHRYDTADYEQIDSLLGTEKDFQTLASQAHARGIRIILDGVFDHTGANSRYFNRNGRFAVPGAFQSQASPYRSWYRFQHWPDVYDCWWGVDEMPQLDTTQPALRDYFCAENGIVRRWLAAGADGWRLDVADELSDTFLESLRAAARAEKPDALLLGEVWEDASDKVAYNARRRYFRGKQLDSVMNYPLRNAILRFVLHGDAAALRNTVQVLFTHYPRSVSAIAMNLIGSHDTVRVLTALAGIDISDKTGSELRDICLTTQEKKRAIMRVKLAATLQFTLPGVPCIYYGDEAGMQGARDPFCRMPFPWGAENRELLTHYQTLGTLRRQQKALWDSEPDFLLWEPGHVIFRRMQNNHGVLVLANASEEPMSLRPYVPAKEKNLLNGKAIGTALPACSAAVIAIRTRKTAKQGV